MLDSPTTSPHFLAGDKTLISRKKVLYFPLMTCAKVRLKIFIRSKVKRGGMKTHPVYIKKLIFPMFSYNVTKKAINRFSLRSSVL